MDHATSKITKNGIVSSTEEIHWIESESLFAASTILSTTGNNNDDDGKRDHEVDEDDLCLDDLFIDPDPYETFTLQWKILYIEEDDDDIMIGDCSKNEHNSSQIVIDDPSDDMTKRKPMDDEKMYYNMRVIETNGQITVVGNKAENGQTLHSTGLTLWRASQLLTDYLVAIHNQHQISVLQQLQQQQHRSTTLPIPYINPYIKNIYNNENPNHDPNQERINNNNTIAVLELGCGLGVPSMLHHYYLTASSSSLLSTSAITNTITIATDADIDTLHNLRHNLDLVQTEQNDLQSSISSSHHTKNMNTSCKNMITCQQLIWGNSMHIQSVLQTLQSYRDQMKNITPATVTPAATIPNPTRTVHDPQNTPTTDGTKCTCTESSIETTHSMTKFDILLGSDIIYVEHVVQPLFETAAQLLNVRHGVFLLAFARRNVSIDYVLSIAQQQGFVYEYQTLTSISTSPSKETIVEDNSSGSSSMEGVYIFRLQHQQ